MRVSFALVLTGLTLILTLLPAVLIWVVFSELMTSSLDLLQGTTATSTKQLAATVQSMLLSSSMQVLDMRLTEGENVMKSMLAFVYNSGLLGLTLRPSYTDLHNDVLLKYQDHEFGTMKGHDYFSMVAMNGGYFPGNSNVGPNTFYIIWQAMNVDYRAYVQNRSLAEQFVPTLYCILMEQLRGERLAQNNISQVDSQTGKPVFTVNTGTYPAYYFNVNKTIQSGWTNDLSFNTANGQVELGLWNWLPAMNSTWLQVSLTISVQTISDQLLAQLGNNTQDRLFMFFRQSHGHMIASSHGKYYSMSDVDRRHMNPYSQKLNISQYWQYTCLNSNDPLIYQACVQLHDMYHQWTAIPCVDLEMELLGTRYWVAVGHSSSSVPYAVVMLKNRQSVMGSIDASQAHVNGEVNDKKAATYVILAVITVAGVIAPLSIGLWLGSRLIRLASGMDQIAKLDFNVGSTPPTLFSELHHFQTSFMRMERGLRAFGKFVPKAVVKVLIDGKMGANDRMANDKLTIMFADIEGFSTICESVPPERLTTVCSEYFEAMCNNIVDHNGTIDKFIGDCIMAMWNAPEPLPCHERHAVDAALAMQSSVMDLHSEWRNRDLPVLKFRLGIHTGPCLVGNFGCSHRVSYTCLGDSVNLSARLEALNKKFGTYLCVSQATYEGCRDLFHFRRLAKVTVPGKTEVLPVYEVLCARASGESAYFIGTVPRLPGTVHPHDEEAPFLPDSLSQLSPPSALSPKSQLSSTSEVFSDRHYSPARMYNPNAVPWHWYRVDRGQLLYHAEAYHAAYDALVAGNFPLATEVLRDRKPLDLPDKAWATLADQLEKLRSTGLPWDGVFYFTEK
eukprot:EG_transcript_1525